MLADLMDKLLVLDPKKRLTAVEALDHPWFWSDPYPEDPAKCVPRPRFARRVARGCTDSRSSCLPRSMPKFTSSHEYDKRKKFEAHQQAFAAAAPLPPPAQPQPMHYVPQPQQFNAPPPPPPMMQQFNGPPQQHLQQHGMMQPPGYAQPLPGGYGMPQPHMGGYAGPPQSFAARGLGPSTTGGGPGGHNGAPPAQPSWNSGPAGGPGPQRVAGAKVNLLQMLRKKGQQ